MPLPEQFSPVEFLQDLVRRYANREVREFFSDLGGDEWEPDITTSRGALRTACTHDDSDPVTVTVLRWLLFQHVRSLPFQQPYYGIPVAEINSSRRYRPQITLFFQEDPGDIEVGYAPVTGEVSFRLMDHSSSTITPAVASTFANRIDNSFATGGGYVWRKGRLTVTYNDWGRGYALRVLCRTQSEGRALIERVLDIQNHTPDWTNSNVSENQAEAAAFPIVPGNEMIYGRMRRSPRRRPIADVRFQYAKLDVHGLPHPVVLVDRSGTWPNALVKS